METTKVKKVSIFLAYIKFLLYLCSRFWEIMSEDVRNNIIKTAGEMFFRLGIRSVSIDDICHELGISKKTFYVYFASKDELIEQLLSANVSRMEQKMRTTMESSDFSAIVRKFTQWITSENKDVRKVPQLVYDLKKYYSRQYNDYQDGFMNIPDGVEDEGLPFN